MIRRQKMNLSYKKHLIFDFDGTISGLTIDWSNSRAGWVELAEKLTGESGLKIEDNPYVFQEDIIKKVGPKATEAYIDFAKNYEKENYSGYDPNMMIVGFIQDNKDKYEFSLWTSNHLETIKPILDELGLTDIFSKTIGRNSVTYPKPNPDGFSQIFVEGSDKKDYLMIGDTRNDEEAAQAAGIDFIHVVDFEQELQK